MDIPVKENSANSPPARRGFTIDEFCRRYPVGRTKVYGELSSGRLRARKIGRRTIITADDAEAWFSRLPIMGRPA
jgi:excisionase family DNA binding protein